MLRHWKGLLIAAAIIAGLNVVGHLHGPDYYTQTAGEASSSIVVHAPAPQAAWAPAPAPASSSSSHGHHLRLRLRPHRVLRFAFRPWRPRYLLPWWLRG